MGTVSLEGIEFFAYHGVSDQEQRVGNRYSVDVHINSDFTEAAINDDLSKTIDYAKVYAVVQAVMQQPTRLLEHIAHNILEGVRQVYPQINSIEVQVSKHNPPIGGVCDRSKITIKWPAN